MLTRLERYPRRLDRFFVPLLLATLLQHVAEQSRFPTRCNSPRLASDWVPVAAPIREEWRRLD